MSKVIRPKQNYPTNQPRPGSPTPMVWLGKLLQSSVGSKILVALTGIALIGFVVGHMAGNLQIFVSQSLINHYAEKLHSLGPILWVIRGVLLAILVTHLTLAIRLKSQSATARPVPYYYHSTIQATWASRYMLSTGIVVGTFLLFHLAHFTVTAVSATVTIENQAVNYSQLRDSEGLRDVYSMVIYGFQKPVVSGLYLVAQLALFFHLTHGAASVFQTLSLNSTRFQSLIRTVAFVLALGLLIGNSSIVLACQLGYLQPNPDVAKTLSAVMGG
ncbi:succinate dehydrogenase cytochrome b subunit [Tuwongella immobilis]|uniref:Succinate dehydrogenase cytochrome B subunit, b558 family n=1 Tax=Tuwongella immobilis TaxID=692036 RepID=A0A6C2YMZ6_9BACT|nr:succinate dehydrogenase cytochrome b subunit [Tuwongella immobilis]VIP02282.1 Succinate dehydrogenase cytochrome B subunit, b558 family OS=Leptospira noguchii serovar Autumnalis str. ZUN142 GN=sdhC PE=4 SV=1 [Tuwongella immobilis]VTS00932.1 Succinate dehydrogenase cytochrome B subunit, b558 family OS=Leptospira noguchii serovar Autumnalis str. ZUN142 GN=sdhC PE=4 SV=1 [Tuwongella immobilis]